MHRPTDSTLLALLLAACLATLSPAHAARSDWREMSVGHFHLFSTLSDSKTRTVARNLQAFEQTVGVVLQSDDRLPDIPTNIYLLDRGEFRKYAAPGPGAGGFFSEGWAANTIVVDGEEDFDWVKLAVFHEYTHFILLNTRTLRFPPWYMEGYAELFSSMRLTKDSVVLGEAPKGLMLSLESPEWIPMERLLAVKLTDPEYRAEKLMPQFYGESWVLVHLLLFDDKTLAAPTSDYLRGIDVGYPEPDAFKSNFPFDKAALDLSVKKLIRGRVIHIKKLFFKAPPEIDEAPLTRLPTPRADAEMARLVFGLGKPPAIVDPMIASARAGAPDDLAIKALAARISAHETSKIDIAALTALASGDAATPRIRLDIADALLADGGRAEAAKAVLPILDGIIHADNPPIEAVMLWTQAARLADVAPASVAAVLEPAAKRAPHNTNLLQHLAAASEVMNDKVKARSYYTRIILVSQNEKERIWAQKQADSARLADDPAPAAAPVGSAKPAAKPPAKAPAKPPDQH